jgi:urease accessory protein
MEAVRDSTAAATAIGSTWDATLKLRYERRGLRSVLAGRSCEGPLAVQKSLYPEGDAVCQNIIVHPPAGIAGGDTLTVDIDVGPQACAQLTTPGATKWYRSAGPKARQRIVLRVGAGAILEWLPQEAIVFDGAIAELDTKIDLASDALYIGWELVCLGRTAAGERFSRGQLRQRVALARDGVPAFIERATLDADAALLASPVGLNGAVVFGTFLAACTFMPDAVLATCRALAPRTGEGAITSVRGCTVARYRGGSAEAARAYFVEIWRHVRPALVGRGAVPPRIWNT